MRWVGAECVVRARADLVAAEILRQRFARELDQGEKRGESCLELADFQLEGVRRAEMILRERGGVLIADSVGLGKTYIALGLIETALRTDRRVGVIAPAALRRGWTVPLDRLVRSLGMGPGRVIWTSHTHLARGTAPKGIYDGLDLLVVDEAHAFRNPRTRRYRALATISRGAELVLISATPVNNSLEDLYALVRLFAGDHDFSDLGIADLRGMIRQAIEGEGSSESMPELQALLGAIMIRRTRSTLGTRVDQLEEGWGPSFPRRAPPAPIRYSLDTVYPGLLGQVVEVIEGLTFEPYLLTKENPGPVVIELLRLGLLKRLESSLAAFESSLRRQSGFARAFLESLDRGFLRLPREHRLLEARGDRDGEQFVLEEFRLEPVPPGLDREELRRKVEGDRVLLDGLLARLSLPSNWTGEGEEPMSDAKLIELIRILDEEIGDEKVVIFTEFRETARYLWRALRGRGRVGLIDGGVAYLGLDSADRQAVIDRFAPVSNHASEPPTHERVDILIATDVLAEGLNLQDARAVVSYDLPWNPVRVMQRVGRVDRLGALHEIVRPYHFLPDAGLDEVMRLVPRLGTKIRTIEASVGTEGTVIGGVGEGEGRYEGIEAEERLRSALHTLSAKSTTGRWRGDGVPVATLSVRAGGIGPEGCLLLALRIRGRVTFLLASYDEPARTRVDDATASAILLAALADDAGQALIDPERTEPVGRGLVYSAICAANEFVRGRLESTLTGVSLSSDAPGAVAGKQLLAALQTRRGERLDPHLSRRVERLLPILARGHPIGIECEIRGALRSAGEDGDALALVEVLEGIFAREIKAMKGVDWGPVPGTPEADDEYELIGIIEVPPL